MPLLDQQPKDLPPDLSRMETIDIISPADGCAMKVDVYSPTEELGELNPLVLAPHPVTWTAEQDYHVGLEGLFREYHRGYYGLAQKHGVILALPHGHHHKEDLCSLAGPEQIADMFYLIDNLSEFGYQVDPKLVYVCGLSMGAQEALVLAGKHPDKITATFAFNPIVDLAAWHEELATSDIPEIREYDTAARIANEVGGLPSEIPEAYAERSATNFIEGFRHVPTMIYWSEQDLVVPRQVTHHTIPLYQAVKGMGINSPMAEYNHTLMHGPLEYDQRTRWQLHEWCDYDLAIRWLLCHSK